jgi:hypothetical protein
MLQRYNVLVRTTVKARRESYGKLTCGRFIVSKFPADVARWLATSGALPNSPPRYNAAPTQDMALG